MTVAGDLSPEFLSAVLRDSVSHRVGYCPGENVRCGLMGDLGKVCLGAGSGVKVQRLCVGLLSGE